MDTWDNHAASAYAGGTGSSTNPYKIQTSAQLALLAKQSKTNKFSGVYFSLEQSVDMSEYLWDGIGVGSYSFAGNFNGNLNFIRGITIYAKDGTHGFFNMTNNASIKKVYLTEGLVYVDGGEEEYGGLVAYGSNTSIDSCVVEGFTFKDVSNTHNEAGIIVGMFYNSTITNCLVKDCMSENRFYVTGYCDDGWDSSTIKNCTAINVKYLGFPWSFDDSKLSFYDITRITTADGVVRTKYISGSSSDYGDFVYSANLNGGYPIQKSLALIANVSSQTSSQVYNYLVSNKGFSK